jgi:GNAT superfamily N-acetyltransferase
MEDIFVVCDLEKLWNHPLNMGWVNLFARWATSRTFRTWWPLLAPLYGPAFVRFMRERFGILDRRLSVEEAKKAIEKTGPDEELDEDSFAWNWWGDRSRPTPERGTKTAYAYQMQFEGVKKPLSLGLALVSISKDAPKASWTTDDFFVPPSLWGGGIGGTFMHALLAKLKDDGIQKFEVDVILTPTQRDDATRADRLGFIEFYKAHHFRLKAVDLADEDARKRWVWTRLVLEV